MRRAGQSDALRAAWSAQSTPPNGSPALRLTRESRCSNPAAPISRCAGSDALRREPEAPSRKASTPDGPNGPPATGAAAVVEPQRDVDARLSGRVRTPAEAATIGDVAPTKADAISNTPSRYPPEVQHVEVALHAPPSAVTLAGEAADPALVGHCTGADGAWRRLRHKPNGTGVCRQRHAQHASHGGEKD